MGTKYLHHRTTMSGSIEFECFLQSPSGDIAGHSYDEEFNFEDLNFENFEPIDQFMGDVLGDLERTVAAETRVDDVMAATVGGQADDVSGDTLSDGEAILEGVNAPDWVTVTSAQSPLHSSDDIPRCEQSSMPSTTSFRDFGKIIEDVANALSDNVPCPIPRELMLDPRNVVDGTKHSADISCAVEVSKCGSQLRISSTQFKSVSKNRKTVSVIQSKARSQLKKQLLQVRADYRRRWQEAALDDLST